MRQLAEKPSKKLKATSPIPTTAATSRNTQTPTKKVSQQELPSKVNKPSVSKPSIGKPSVPKASDKPSIIKGEFKIQPATPTRQPVKSIQTTPINVKSQKASVVSKNIPPTIQQSVKYNSFKKGGI